MIDEGTLQVRIAGEDASGGMFASAMGHADQFAASVGKMGEQFQGVFDRMVERVISFEIIFRGAEAAIDTFRESLAKADEMRDLSLSLDVFTGSVAKGREAMEYFEQQAAKTRDTADELGKTFRDLLPLSQSRGFTAEGMEQVTVMLSQLGTVAGRSLDEMESGFRRLLSGQSGGAARNPLLAVLGLNKNDLDLANKDFDAFLDVVLKRMQDVSTQAEGFGQSWESTWHKVKDTLLEDIAGGFNDAGDAGRGAMQEIIDAANDPNLKEALQDVGSAIRTIVDLLAAVSTTGAAAFERLSNFGNLGFAAFMDTNTNPNNSTYAYGLQTGSATPQQLRALRAGRQAGGYYPQSGWEAALGMQPEGLGITGLIGGPGNLDALFQNLGTVLQQHPDKVKQIMESIGDEVHDGVIKWTDYTSSVAYALKGADTAIEHHSATTKKAAEDVQDSTLKLRNTLKDLGMVPWELSPDQTTLLDPRTFNVTGTKYNPPQSPMSMLGMVDPEINARTLADARKKYEKGLADDYAAELAAQLHDSVTNQFANDFASLFSQGGRDFVHTMERDWNALMGQGAKFFAEELFGKAAVKDAAGNIVQPGTQGALQKLGLTDKQAQGGMAMLETGIGAYSYAASGGQNSVTQGILGGAMAGASVGGYYGAVIGAIIGGIAAELGKQQASRDYQYARVSITDGTVHAGDFRNVSSGDQTKMIADTQTAFDTAWNSWVQVMFKANAASLIPDRGKMPSFTNFNNAPGQISQTSPYASFMSDFNLWLTQQLPDQIAGKFKDGMQTAAQKIGLSADQFNAIWDKFDALDPKVAVQDWLALFDVLSTVTGAISGSAKGGPGMGASFLANKNWLTQQGNLSFTQKLGQSDADLFTQLQMVMAETGDQQIKDAQSLAQLVNQRYTQEKDFINQIIGLEKQAATEAQNAKNSITMMTLHKADGSPDYEAQAKFLQTQANGLLQQIMGATDPNQAHQFYQQYLQVIQQIVGLGYQQGTSTGDAYAKWAQQQIDLGQNAFKAVTDKIGKDLDNANQQFLAQFQPIWDGFKNSVAGLTDSIGGGGGGNGGGGGGGGGGPRNPDNLIGTINSTAGAMSDFYPVVDSTTASMSALNSAVINLLASINAAASNANFLASTAGARI